MEEKQASLLLKLGIFRDQPKPDSCVKQQLKSPGSIFEDDNLLRGGRYLRVTYKMTSVERL